MSDFPGIDTFIACQAPFGLHYDIFWQLFFYPPASNCTQQRYGDVSSEDTWLVHSSCIPQFSSVKIGVDSNVFSYNITENLLVIVDEIYEVRQISFSLVQ